MDSLEVGCGEDGRLLSVVELESLVGGSGERRNQGGLRKEQRNALKEPAASKTRRTPQQERGLIRRTLGRDNACTRRRDSPTPTSSTCTDSVAYALSSLNNPTRPAHPPVVLHGLNGALRIAQESSEVLRATLWSTLIQVGALRVGLEEDDLMSVTEADARTALTKVGKSCYLDDIQPGCTSPLLIKCMNQNTTEMQTEENKKMDLAKHNCDGHRLINCQRLVGMSTTRVKVEVMATILNATLARDGLKRQGYMSLKQPTSPASALPTSGLGLTQALKRKVKSSPTNTEKKMIHLRPPYWKSNGCNASRGGGGGPCDTVGLRHELMAAEDSVAHFTLAVRSDLAWVKSNAEVESGKLTVVPSLSVQVKHRCQKWGAEKMVGALYSALIRIEQPYFATWRSKTTFSALTELSVQYVRFRGANVVGEMLIKWGNKRAKVVLQQWSTICKLIRRQEERRAALDVTRCIRGFLGRCRSRHLQYLRAASTLQMTIRRWLSLKELERRKERKLIEKASIVINGTTRVYLAKRRFKRLRMERHNQIKAVIIIQSVTRGRKEKKRYQQIYQAVILVQALVRMFSNRNTLKMKKIQRQKENESISIVQCWWRCYLARKQYADLLNARMKNFYATEIRHSIRKSTGYGGNSLILPPVTAIELSRENAAFVIQRSVRSMLARREFQRLAQLNKNIQATSQKVQSTFGCSRVRERNVAGYAATTKTSLLQRSGRNLDETGGGIESMVNDNSSVSSNTNRLCHIMHSDDCDKVTDSGSKIAAKNFNEIRNTIAVGQVQKRKTSFRPSFFRSKPEQKPERGDKQCTKGKRLSHYSKDEDRKLKDNNDQIQYQDGLLKIRQSLSQSELANATKAAEIANLERELREAKINENQARLEAAQISEREAERMKREASMVPDAELRKVKDRLTQEQQVVDLLKEEKNGLQSELVQFKMAVEQERMSGRQEVINLVQELIHDSQQIDGTKEKEERTGDASVTGEHQHLERKQLHVMLELFATEKSKKIGSEMLEVMTQDLANEKIITKDQHDKIQSLSAELSHINAKLKAVCKEKSHETLIAEGSAILASLDNEEDEEEEEGSEIMLNNKAKETGSFIVTRNEEKDKVENLERTLAITQAKLTAYEKKEAQTTSSSMLEHRSSPPHPTVSNKNIISEKLNGTSAIDENYKRSSSSSSNSKSDIERKFQFKQSKTKKQIPFSQPSHHKINSKPPVDHLRRVSPLQAGRRTSNVNGDLLPINHHYHSKKVLVKPEQRGSSSIAHGMMNHQLPADWEEFWDDSVGASYFFNASTQEATWTLPKGSNSAEETILITARKEEQGEEDWIQQWDEASSRPYWFNMKKNETTWVKPNSILLSDNNSRAADAFGDSSGLNAVHATQDNPEEWVAYLDADKGEEYWYNTTTGEVKWS